MAFFDEDEEKGKGKGSGGHAHTLKASPKARALIKQSDDDGSLTSPGLLANPVDMFFVDEKDDGVRTIYAAMEFPPYKFQEYPKQITLPDGTIKVVFSQSEEMNSIIESPQVSAGDQAQLLSLADQNAKLQAQLAELMAKLETVQADHKVEAKAEAEIKPDPEPAAKLKGK